MRWSRYVASFGDDHFADLWAQIGDQPTVLVVGGGFDPRVPRALQLLSQLPVSVARVVRLDVGPDRGVDDLVTDLALANRKAVSELVSERAWPLIDQEFPNVQARRSAGIAISREFHAAGYLEGATQVVVDVSGLPRSVFFPLVHGLIQTADARRWSGNVHVVATASSELDAAITKEGAEDPSTLGGFAARVRSEEAAATVWVPVLGQGMAHQVEALVDTIDPDEVVPVLPFPARDPRRGDSLLLEHRELLVERLSVEPRNYLYASEQNPFDLYRAVTDLRARYRESLRPLGDPRFVLSAHSSKLLSIGVLLAAHEMELEVMHVNPTRYGLREDVDVRRLSDESVIASLWLTGDAYQ